MGEIVLDGISFHFGDALQVSDDDGVEWYATDVKGIRGAPTTRLFHTERPGTYGSFRGDNFKGARGITIGGDIAAPSPVVLREAEERLLAICSDPTRVYPLRYSDEYAVRYMYVELNGDFNINPVSTYKSTFDDIPLIAADPRKFADWTTATAGPLVAGSGGVLSDGTGVGSTGDGVDSGTAPYYPQVSVSNPGTAEGLLVVEFAGPCTNPTLLNINDGRSVTFRGALESGRSLWVNLSAQYAHEVPGMPLGSFLEGRSMYGASGYYGGGSLTVANGDYPDLPARATSTFMFVNGQGNVHARPAYW